jgi:hypothetical protein
MAKHLLATANHSTATAKNSPAIAKHSTAMAWRSLPLTRRSLPRRRSRHEAPQALPGEALFLPYPPRVHVRRRPSGGRSW